MAVLAQYEDGDFETKVLGSTVPVMVEFGAAWCPPCRAMAPHLERLAERFAGRVTVVTMDADVSVGSAARCGIRGVPTTILFKNGKPVGSVVGAVPLRTLEALVTPHLS